MFAALAMAATAHVAPAAELTIDRDTGRVVIRNDTASAVSIAGYSVLSSEGALNPSNWLSITENYDSNSGGDVDPNNEWFHLAANANELGEGTLGAADLEPSQTIDLGVGAWMPGASEEVGFEYVDASNDSVVQGMALFVTSTLAADFNMDGVVNGDDFLTWQANFGTVGNATKETGDANLDGDVDGDDFLIWQTEFGSSEGGAGALAAAAVPEPTTLWLAIFMGALASARRVRQPRLQGSTADPVAVRACRPL